MKTDAIVLRVFMVVVTVVTGIFIAWLCGFELSIVAALVIVFGFVCWDAMTGDLANIPK